METKHREISINEKLKIGNMRPFVLIAGLCVIESEDILRTTAEKLVEICSSLSVPLIFKASFDKANRTSIESFRGPGMKQGLKLLKAMKAEFGFPILTDVHTAEQPGTVAEVADVIQIPAFLCRQTDLILSASKTGKCINIKKGQFLSPGEMKGPISKVESTGNRKIIPIYFNDSNFC